MITIVMPIYERLEHFGHALRGLLHQTCRDFELIVVNDGGSKHVPMWLVRGFEREPAGPRHGVRILYLDPPSTSFRAGMARNCGAASARGERIIFLDSDCAAAANLVQSHASYIGKPDLVCGMIRRVAIQKAQRFPFPPVGDVGKPDLRYTMFPQIRRPLIRQVNFVTQCYEACWTGHMSVPADRFCEIGGFWESIEGYGSEDQDLAFRFHRAGWPLRMDFRIQAWHIDHEANGNLRGRAALAKRDHVIAASALQPVHRPSRFFPPGKRMPTLDSMADSSVS